MKRSRRRELGGAALAQRRRGEGDVGGDVEAAGAVVGVERVVAGAKRVASTQPSSIMNSPQAWSESIGNSVRSRSNRARFTAATLFGEHLLQQRHRDRALARERELVEAVELRHEVLEVAREARQQVVHDLVGEEGAAPVGFAAKRRAHLGLAERREREDMAPAEAGAQVLAHVEVDRRHAAGGDDAGAARRRVDEERERRLLLGGIERVRVVDDEPVALAGRRPRRGRRCREPGRLLAVRAARSTSACSRCVLPLPAGPQR
jgi:hypothetical protein